MTDPILELPFSAGLDEATREELVQPGAGWAELQNTRQERRGGLSKRLGFAGLAVTRSGASDRSAGRRLFAHKGVPTVIDGTHVDSYVEAATTNVTRSRIPECSYSSTGLPAPSASGPLYDVEYCNGFAAVTYGATLSGTVRVALVDAATGAVIRSPENIGSGNGVATVGSFGSRYFVLALYTVSTTAVAAYILDTQAISTGWVSLATVAATTGATPVICSLTDRVAIVYGTTSGATRVEVKTYNASGVVETTAITCGVTPTYVTLSGSIAGTLWCAWDEDTAVKAIGLDADALGTPLATAATVLTAFVDVAGLGICEGSASGTARVWALESTEPTDMLCRGITTVAGAVTTPAADVNVRNVRPSSRPFQQGGRYYMALYPAYDSSAGGNSQALCIVVDWTDDVTYVRPVANVMPGLIAVSVDSAKFSPVGTTGRWIHGFQIARSGEANTSEVFLGETVTGCELLTLDFATRDRWQPVDHANATFLGGALLSVYDGERATEVGFLARPTKVTLADGSTGITGTYRYVAIYEDIDAAGNWVVSGISDVSAPITVTNRTISLTTRVLAVSSRIAKGTTRVAWYRTATGGEPPYYRLGVTANDTSNPSATFADNITDATLTAKAKLYAPSLPGTAGESQDRRAPPGLVHLESYAGMLVGAHGESLFFSGQEVYGEATWFSPVFEVPLTGGGRTTGLKAQDGSLFVFKEDRIFVLAGEAPSDNGALGGFGVPRILASDVGCIEPNSIVTTSLGVFFQSSRGIELLNRGGAVSWIGEQVQATLASYPVVTSAVLDQRAGLVRFSLAASEASGAASGNGRDVVFDLTLGAWVSVDSKTGASGAQASQDACSVYYDGAQRYAWMGVDGIVYVERDSDDASAHLDGSTWTTMRAVTPWVHLAGIHGEQFVDQVLLLAKSHTGHDLAISVAFDFSASYTNTKTFTAAQIAALAREWLVREVTQTTSNAVRVKIEDATPSSGSVGTGQGATWVALTFNGQPHRGPKRTSPAQRGG